MKINERVELMKLMFVKNLFQVLFHEMFVLLKIPIVFVEFEGISIQSNPIHKFKHKCKGSVIYIGKSNPIAK